MDMIGADFVFADGRDERDSVVETDQLPDGRQLFPNPLSGSRSRLETDSVIDR
jgi:hypothetical protein